MTRRLVVRWALSLLALAPFARVRLFAQARSLDEGDRATLRALARVALPSPLGDDGARRVLGVFGRLAGDGAILDTQSLTFSALTLRSAEETGHDLGWTPAATELPLPGSEAP